MSHDTRNSADRPAHPPAYAAQPMRESRNPCAPSFASNLQNLALFLRYAPVRPLLYPEQSTHVGDAGCNAGGKT